MTHPQEKILIVGPSWVGDMVMAQSLFKTLKQLSPNCLIDVLAPKWSLPILERMPEVHNSIVMPLGHNELRIVDRLRLGQRLRHEHYQRAIVLPNSLKSAFVPYFANIPVRTGWRGEWRYGWLNDLRRLKPQKIPLMVERFTALAFPPDHPKAEGNTPLAEIPQPTLQPHLKQLPELVKKYQLSSERKILALCPGAEFGGAKRWPAGYYAAVAADRIKGGWQAWIFGSENDQPVADEITQALSEQQRQFCHCLTGKTTLADAVDLLSMADAVISNDSGLMHIAAALQRPLVALYGATSADFTPPLSDRVKILSIDLECAPCFQRECPKRGSEYHQCMLQLKPERVLQTLQQLLVAPGE